MSTLASGTGGGYPNALCGLNPICIPAAIVPSDHGFQNGVKDFGVKQLISRLSHSYCFAHGTDITTRRATPKFRPELRLRADLDSSRQGRDPAGESPAAPIARFRYIAMPRSALHTCSASRVAPAILSCREHRDSVRICALGLTYSHPSSSQIIRNHLCTNMLWRNDNVTPSHVRSGGRVLRRTAMGKSQGCRRPHPPVLL